MKFAKVKMSIFVAPSIARALRVRAALMGVSKSEVIAMLLRGKVKR